MIPAKYSLAELTRCEAGMEKAKKSAQELAKEFYILFNKIRDEEQWRANKRYKSWPDYLDKRWNLTPQRGNQLASSGAFLLGISENLETMVSNERQIRELKKLPPSVQEKAAEKTIKRDGDLTSKGISKTVKESPDEYQQTEPAGLSEPKEKAVVKDELGWPIPTESLDFWNRREELQALLGPISQVKCAIEKGRDAGDPLFLGLNQSILGELKTVYWRIKQALPYAVCTTCSGRPGVNGHCIICHDTGFIHEDVPSSNPYVADVLKIRTNVLAAK